MTVIVVAGIYSAFLAATHFQEEVYEWRVKPGYDPKTGAKLPVAVAEGATAQPLAVASPEAAAPEADLPEIAAPAEKWLMASLTKGAKPKAAAQSEIEVVTDAPVTQAPKAAEPSTPAASTPAPEPKPCDLVNGERPAYCERFTYPSFLLFGMSVGSFIVAYFFQLAACDWDRTKVFAALYQAPKKDRHAKVADLSNPRFNSELVFDFFLVSLTFMGAMFTTNLSLQFCDMATQILIKSAKMVPIVVGGFLVFKKTYPWYDYSAVGLITGGLIVYNFLAEGGDGGKAANSKGVAICIASLFCDGMTGPRQDKVNGKYVITGLEHMLFTNMFAILPAAVLTIIMDFTIFAKGAGPLVFCMRHPQIIYLCAAYCLCNTMGQLFIFQGLALLGALYLSVITTTRKFWSVLWSLCKDPTKLSKVKPLQWVSIFVVFGALLMQQYYAQMEKAKKKAAIANADLARTLQANEMSSLPTVKGEKEAGHV